MINVADEALEKIFGGFAIKEPGLHTCPVCKSSLSRALVDDTNKGWIVEVLYKCSLKVRYSYLDKKWSHIDDCTNATALVLTLVADQIDKEQKNKKEQTRFTSLDNEKLPDDDIPF